MFFALGESNLSTHQLLEIRDRIVANFLEEHWLEIGLLTGYDQLIQGHDRLLRSLHWGDEDYSGNVLKILTIIASQNDRAIKQIEDYLDARFEGNAIYVSAKPSERKITFSPDVFDIPTSPIERDLVAVMMPFDAGLSGVYSAIQTACLNASFRAVRADSIWDNSTIIQDIFDLIYRSTVVVVDFTGKNPNVMYETGIAHTLGKLVVPISQSIDDIPFDMRHHRVLKYLNNDQGLNDLTAALSTKLSQVGA